jgi:general stress protein CsbA
LAYLNTQNMFYFILKGLNLFFVFLLMQIYKSAGYKKFIRTDLRTYLVMASNYKADIMAYFYNNKKLE